MMDRAQFMRELEELLADISETERQDALEFYNNYFDDAGIENEASVIRDLGSPEKVAAILTFHSGEDKLVKKALKEGYREGIYSDYAKDVVRPSARECAQNGRARSTKMRWAVKC